MPEIRTRTTLAVVTMLVLCAGFLAAQTTSNALYLDPSQPVDARVSDLIGKMTLEAL